MSHTYTGAARALLRMFYSGPSQSTLKGLRSISYLLGIGTMYYPEGGGGELATHLHYKALAKQGWTITAVGYTFNFKHPIHEAIDGVAVYRIPSPVPRELIHQFVATKIDPLLMKVIQKLRSKYDVAHVAEHVYSAIPYIKSLSRKPVVVHVHDDSPVCYFGSHRSSTRGNLNDLCVNCSLVSCILRRRITRLTHQLTISRVAHLFSIPAEIPTAIYVSQKRREYIMQADAILTVSNNLAKKLRYLIPESADKTMTVYNPLPEVKKYAKPYNTNRPTLLFAGGSIYEKGIFHLLKIWKLLAETNRNLELYVANGMDSLSLRHAIKKYKLASMVKLFPKLTHEKVMKLTACTHAAAVPSLASEGLSYAVIEPMATGRAVFASPVGGIPEILKNGCGGYLINPWNVTESANLLAKIANFDEIVKQGKYGKKNITRLLAYENTTGRLSTILAGIT